MKKFMCFVLSLAMTLSIVSCGAAEEGPDAVVKSFCDGMKKYDLTTMLNCTVGGAEANQEDLTLSEDMPEGIDAYFKELASQMTYTITETTLADDTATVSVNFSHADISPVMTVALGEYITQAFALAFAGASDEDMETLFTNIFTEKMNSVEASTAETVVAFSCAKTDAGWKISEIPEAAAHVLTCNVAKAFEGFAESDDETNGEEEITEEEITNWIDVPVNTEVELATIKVKVTDCIETNELTAEYVEPGVAQEGTKFVVYTVEIENLAKEALTFSSSTFVLKDSQDREYALYDNAFWYFDNFLPYMEFAPNIKQSGNLAFHVPQDCEGYYFALGKSGTSDVYKFMG